MLWAGKCFKCDWSQTSTLASSLKMEADHHILYNCKGPVLLTPVALNCLEERIVLVHYIYPDPYGGQPVTKVL